jgi:hypothetical protein
MLMLQGVILIENSLWNLKGRVSFGKFKRVGLAREMCNKNSEIGGHLRICLETERRRKILALETIDLRLPNSSQQPGRFARMIYRNSFRTSQ